MDAIELCAHGEAAWQRAAHEGLGKAWLDDGSGVARAPDGAAHPFLLGAVTLAPHPTLPGSISGRVCDSYATLGVEDLPEGYTPHAADPWMSRPPGPDVPRDPVPGLFVTEVESDRDTVLFEHTAFVAAGGQPPRRRGELHPPGSQRVPGLHLLLASVDGVPCGTALAVEHEHGLVISAVAVVPELRGRGIGAALTAAALDVAPDRPATLAASAAGLPVYRRLGFREVTRPIHWGQ